MRAITSSKIASGVVDGRGAEFLAQPRLFGAARYRDDLGARGDTELDHRRPDRARATDDQQGLASCQFRASVQRQVADVKRQGEGGGGGVVELGGASKVPVTGAIAYSAMPPSDCLAMATTRRPTHSAAPSPAWSTTPQTSMPRVKGT